MSPEGWMAAAAMLGSLGLGGSGLWVALANRPKMSAEANAAAATGEVTVSADARAWAERADARAEKALARADAAEKRANTADDRARASEERLDSLEFKLDKIVGYVGDLKDQIVALGGDPMPPPRDLIPPLSHP